MELKNLGFLGMLNIYNNNLKAPIPEGEKFDTFTNDFYIGNLSLCELPLSNSCHSDEETPTKIDRDDDGIDGGWIRDVKHL
ncbi:hypothetical protein Goarm_017549 [Gossypium armourianum]|uniref:Uncharacterized protein n=1 Tax=Gossypium armourianum TaxID=34283 RepID=A0A7J9JFN4_9ROSI|nr:hypothetical protein [Gossypium armourianum]